MTRLLTSAVVFTLACTTASFAQPTIDGILGTDEYNTGNTPWAVQDTPTGFGDNLSELNAAYGVLDANGLSLLLTGNLEAGGNGIVIFIDSMAGGAVASTDGSGFGTIGSIGGARSDDWGTDTDGTDGVSPTPGGGSILDPGFNPDRALELNIFDIDDMDGVIDYFINVIDLTVENSENLPGPVPNYNRDVFLEDFTGGSGQGNSNVLGNTSVTGEYYRDENGTAADAFPGTAGFPDRETLSGSIEHAFDNSNTAGVNGFDFGTPPGPLGDPLSATTGLELHFDNDFLGLTGDSSETVGIMAFVTNSDGGFLANQFLGEDGGVGGDSNLGVPGDAFGGVPLFDASLYAGNQYFTVDHNGPVVSVPGDFDGDGDKDNVDIDMYIGLLGTTVPPTDAKFDLDGDNDVDADDYNQHATTLMEWSNAGNGQSGMGTLLGDYNRDGTVSLLDLNTLGTGFGGTGGWADGDTNGDGDITLLDLNALGVTFGQDVFVAPEAPAVPEPASLVLLGLGGMALLRRRS